MNPILSRRTMLRFSTCALAAAALPALAQGGSDKPVRIVLPDPKYTDAPSDVRRRLTKFVNVVMRAGKKSVAEHILYDALESVKEKTQDDPLRVCSRPILGFEHDVLARIRDDADTAMQREDGDVAVPQPQPLVRRDRLEGGELRVGAVEAEVDMLVRPEAAHLRR